jgi:NADH-quinone oxidoreductase subunit N
MPGAVMFHGLGKRNPMLALFMTVAMLSLAGIPITAGFFAKYFIFTVMIGTKFKWLLILAIVTSAVGVYYYLRVIVAMYFKTSERTDEQVIVRSSDYFVIGLAAVLTLILGIVPGTVAEMFGF